MDTLARFVAAQAAGRWEAAQAELVSGAKRGHWMWFVLPQIAGLGSSEMARTYAIGDLAEARAYLAHPLLGTRLAAAMDALAGWIGHRSAEAIMGGIDAVKLRSCTTLFEAAGGGAAFATVIDGFFDGVRDSATLRLIGSGHQGNAD